MSAPLATGSVNSTTRRIVTHTLTGLKRWSCHSRDLPPVSLVKALHVYDFDNTLFMSPLPNQKLWTGQTVGFLQTQECFLNGGWWHDQRILEATGEGIEKEEPKAWEGWWNEQLVNLVELSIQQKDALTILLTGRAEHNFADLIKRIAASKKLPFDMICLKPQTGPNNQKFGSTMLYKQALLRDIVHTYKDADEIRIYEDRPKHTKAFRDFFETFNKTLLSPTAPTPRKPITAEVIQVADAVTTLDPVIETAEVQRMINNHNTAVRSGASSHAYRYEIKRTVFYTGYLISPVDTARLLTLVNLPSGMPESEVKFLANSILITPRPCEPSILERVGGIGYKQTWQVTGMAIYESKIWAARVAPVPPNSAFHTDNPVPIVVLALLKGARPIDAGRIQNWQPVSADKQFVFQSVVGEKVQLRVEREVEGEGEYESLFAHKNLKRRHDQDAGLPDRGTHRFVPPGPHRGGYNNDENRRPSGNPGYRGGRDQSRGRGGNASGGGQHRYPPHNDRRGGRGGGSGGGGGRGGGNNNNRGRSRGGYKSLDDVQNNGRSGGQSVGYQSFKPNYDDGPSGPGGQGYDTTFPALGDGGYTQPGGVGAGGLPYGK